MLIYDMRSQNIINPIGLGTLKPSLSWKLKSEAADRAIFNNYNDFEIFAQAAYRITASSTKEKLLAEDYDLWDSGKICSSANTGIVYEGKALSSYQRIYWQVTAWNRYGAEGCHSDVGFWEMGLLKESDWKGKWITGGSQSVAPILSKEFKLSAEKTLSFARLYISGLGLYEAYVNGKILGKGTYFNPGESDVRDTVYYNTYDITAYLNTEGEALNAVSFMLGNGQYANYRIHRQPGRYYKTDDSRSEAETSGMFGKVKGIAQIVINYSDGSREIIGTDKEWSFIESPITENSWYGGEDYNALLELKGWNDIDSEIPRHKWAAACEVSENIPAGKMTAAEFPPIAISEADTIKPENITVTELYSKAGLKTYLVDMGRNGAGFPEITLNTDTEGLTVKMYPAEVSDMTGFEGHINQASCTQSESDSGKLIYDTYITKASGLQTFHPRFCYHGYRYLEVTAPECITIGRNNFKGYILRTANEKNGFFECSDNILNTINTLTERSIESNMYSTFTDCPQIEKLGWLETPGLMFYSMSQTYNISSWIRKLIKDMADAQYDDGRIAAIAPEYFKIGGLFEDVNWNGSIIFTAWQHYEVYRDITIFSPETYEAMKSYMAYLKNSSAPKNIIAGGHMGEWGEMTSYGKTPVVLVETTAYYRLAVCMSKIAEVIGRLKDKEYYKRLSESIKKDFHENKECYNAKHLYGNGTQSGYGCVLYSGIYFEENEAEIMERLIKSIENTDFHLTSGEVGLKQVFCALAEHERNDIVYKMVMNKTMPSYRYFVDKGLTTLPEYWNFEDLWGTVVRSRNHAMMGHIKEWFNRYLLGIDSVSPGYEKITVKPAFISEVNFANGRVDSIYGAISLSWDKSARTYNMQLTIPAGITAEVHIPRLSQSDIILCNGTEAEYESNARGSYNILKKNLGFGAYNIKSEAKIS